MGRSGTRAYPSLAELVTTMALSKRSFARLLLLAVAAAAAVAACAAAAPSDADEALCGIACARLDDDDGGSASELVGAVRSLCGCADGAALRGGTAADARVGAARRGLLKKKAAAKSGAAEKSNCGCAFGFTCNTAPPPPPSRRAEKVCGVQFFFGEQRFDGPVVVDGCDAELRGMNGQPLTVAFEDYFVAKAGATALFDGDVRFEGPVEFEAGSETVFSAGARFRGSPVIYKSGSVVRCDGGPMDVDVSKTKDGKKKVVVTVEEGAEVDESCVPMGPPPPKEEGNNKKSNKKKP